MRWLKDSILDLLFLLVILSTLFYPSNDALFIIIWVYTCLLLLSKVLALFMPSLQKRASKTTTPNWIYHLIYAGSFGTLLFLHKWYLATAWGIVWVLSITLLTKQKKKEKS